MRILHTIQSADPRYGGPIEGIHQLTSVHTNDTHHEIVSLDHPGSDFLRNGATTVHALGPSGVLGYSPRLVPWLRRNARHYDAVVIHGLWRYSSFGTWLGLRGLGVPFFSFPHGMLDPWFKQHYPFKHIKKLLFWHWTECRVLHDAKAVIFTCDEERLRARTSFPNYRCREEVAALGIRSPPPHAEQQKEIFLSRFPHLRGRRILLYLSRIHPKKGCDLLIDAFTNTRNHSSSPHLVIAGPDQTSWAKELRILADAKGMAEHVTWTGMLEGDLKWGAYRTADAFILPSHQENFGIVVAEALACGLPVLLSNRVQIWREIDSAGAGYIDADDLAGTQRLIRRWLDLPHQERAALSQRARACFDSRFRIEAYARRFEEILQTHGTAQTAACNGAA